MSDPNATGNVGSGGIIGSQDRPELETGGASEAPDPGSSPESYREALRDLMGDLVNYLADEGFSAQSFPNASTGTHLPLDKMNQVNAIRDHLTKLANERAKAHADALGQDWITPESVGTGQAELIDELVAALQEIRGQV